MTLHDTRSSARPTSVRGHLAENPLGLAPRAHRLNEVLCVALGGALVDWPNVEDLQDKPFDLTLRPDLGPYVMQRLRVYMFKATQSHAERQQDTFRIQLSHVPREPSGSYYHFDRSGDAEVLLVGYEPTLDVFLLWDADLHDRGKGFSYSRGVQAPPEAVDGAIEKGVGEATRHLRSAGLEEVVVAALSSHLVEGIARRMMRTRNRLLRGGR